MNKKLMTNILLMSMSMLMAGCSTIEVPAETTQAVIESEVVSSSIAEVEVPTESKVETSSVGVLTETTASAEPVSTEVSEAEQSGITAEDKTMYATSSVNIRAEASADSEKLGSLNLNDSVHVTGSLESGWKQIDYNGVSAYVSSQYLSDTKIEVTAPTVKAPAQDKVSAPASLPQETATSGNQNKDVAPPAQPAPSNDNVFDGDFPVDTQTPEEAAEEVRQAYIDAGWIDENGNRIDGGNWSQ